jgi:hypothetical protein
MSIDGTAGCDINLSDCYGSLRNHCRDKATLP